jgi:predicted metal-binding membrane protein
VDGERDPAVDRHVMHGHAGTTGAVGFWPLTGMWLGMMTAMMAPTVWPWVRSFHRLSDRESGQRVRATAEFVAGYLIAWLAYSIGAASLQLVLERAGMLRHATASVTSGLGAAVFLFAGLYQFAPIKRACLTHCRTPLGYFLSRWHDGPANGFRLGINHGLFCVGCCWALMLLMFAVGVGNVAWMLALGAVMAAEKNLPWGRKLSAPLGVALIGWGGVILLNRLVLLG